MNTALITCRRRIPVVTVRAALWIAILWTVLLASSSHAATLRVPDDHRSIQAAIDAAKEGDVVLVAPGTYRERVALREGVILKSVGADVQGELGLKRAEVTIIDGGGMLGKGAGVTMAARATLDGFTVTNVGKYDEELWQKHHATQGDEQSHEHIGAPGTPGVAVIGVTCMIQNCIVHHIGYTGIAIQGVEGRNSSPQVFRNVCYRNMGGGIGSMKKSTAVIEENTCFENFYAGIGHDDASPLVINNRCYKNVRAGIGISEGSCPIVRGNKCFQNRRAGIGTRTHDDTRPLIEDNDCYENDMAGIGTDEEAAPMIRNNRCYRNKLAGIGSRNHASPTIVGNECFENEAAGIGQMSDAHTLLIGNYCHHNKTAGIGFATCKAGSSTVIDNRLIDNTLVAIGINAGWTVHAMGNELSRDGGLPPMVMVFNGSEATFTDNTIRGSGVAGLRVAGKVRADRNRFVGTSLRKGGPPNFAIWALPGADVTLTENSMTTWRHALHATKAKVVAINNRAEQFHRAAFVVEQADDSTVIRDNTAISDDESSDVVKVSGQPSVVANNTRKKPARPTAKGKP